MNINKKSLAPMSLLVLLILAGAARADVRVPSIIGDNMVLQQGRKVRVWGWAEPGERVTLSFRGDKASATADARGRWEVFTEPHKAGGPFELTVAGRNTLTFKNVLVGEVWVCSGQSNMEWSLANAQDGAKESAAADYPSIHLFTVAKKTSPNPLEDVEGRWVVTTPKEAASFSAVGYFFGRELYQRLKAPVGLIHTSWGGTPAEAWTSRDTLASVAVLKPMLDRYNRQLQDLPQLQREYETARVEWERQYVTQDPGNKGEPEGYAKPQHDLNGWKRMKLPQLWESAGLDVDGVVWFRRELDVPAAWAGKDLTLKLGAIDDFDTTYFNGERVGSTGPETPSAWTAQRRYRVPGSLVHAGRNTVAVRVFDRVGGGGFGGGEMSLAPADTASTSGVALDGEWSYMEEATVPSRQIDYSRQPQAPGPANQNSPTVLYNAMLAPLFPYAIRGAIWYQGESNAGRAEQYRTLFPAMIRDWRAAWGLGDFPFYFVQLANWKARPADSIDSEWAELREAQTLTMRAAPNTGMAVVIDIGNPDDIHPRNKLDVGLRLARWALADTYGWEMEKSGPLYDSYKVEGDRVRVRFTHAGGLKTRDGAAPTGFYVAGADHKFVPAEARIEKGAVIVWSKDVPSPVAVRYAWSDNPAANLYNSEGLPASPFRTDDWPGLTAGHN
ncbi:MAG: sialate O-acetylesterase [Acidobacteriota bacterium]|jgi:sialate O-acetylesterase|nr:sialate O-acetylesterase [Acidobacteriota bacterium]